MCRLCWTKCTSKNLYLCYLQHLRLLSAGGVGRGVPVKKGKECRHWLCWVSGDFFEIQICKQQNCAFSMFGQTVCLKCYLSLFQPFECCEASKQKRQRKVDARQEKEKVCQYYNINTDIYINSNTNTNNHKNFNLNLISKPIPNSIQIPISLFIGDVLFGRGLCSKHWRDGNSHSFRAKCDHEGDPRWKVPLPGMK